MKQIVVISGKGGTGKTSIVAALAGLGPKKVLADCDVDAADLHLILHPNIIETQPFVSGEQPSIDPALCDQRPLPGPMSLSSHLRRPENTAGTLRRLRCVLVCLPELGHHYAAPNLW